MHHDWGIALLGCGDAVTYTLYRNSVVLENARLHVATFDAADGEQYNSENCQAARDLFQQQPVSRRGFGMWTIDGEHVIEHLAGIEDFQLAMATYRAACQRWPGAAITPPKRSSPSG